MDQNPTPPSSSDTPNAQNPQAPVAPSAPEVPPVIPPSVPPVAPPPADLPVPQPATPAPVTEPSVNTPATPVATASTEHQTPPSSLPPASHKKTIAVAAAGISVILVVVGVYAMTKENFNTQTKQEAASNAVAQPQQIANTEPTASPTPSDPVEQAIGAADTALMNADEEASMADQGLNATPAALE